MAGNTTVPKFESPQVFDITVPGPIDTRYKITSLSAVSTELPLGVRYTGLMCWVDDLKKFYYFKFGVNDSDFIEFAGAGGGGSGTFKVGFTFNEEIYNGSTFTHNLGSQLLNISFHLNNKNILMDYEFTTGNEHNSITFRPPIGANIPIGLQMSIIG